MSSQDRRSAKMRRRSAIAASAAPFLPMRQQPRNPKRHPPKQSLRTAHHAQPRPGKPRRRTPVCAANTLRGVLFAGSIRFRAAMAAARHQPFKLGLVKDDLEQTLPASLVAPTTKPAMRILPIAIFGRQVAPRRSCSKDPENAVDKTAIVLRHPAPIPFLAREMRRKY